MKTVGERHWTGGPVLVAPKRLHQQLVKSFTDEDAKPIKKLKKAVGIGEVAGTPVIYLNPGQEVCCKPWGSAAAVIVYGAETKESKQYLLEGDRKKAFAVLDPRDHTGKWQTIGTVGLEGASVMFDASAKDPEGAARERKSSLDVPLAKGEYVVEVASGTTNVKPYPSKVVQFTYRYVRLRGPDWIPPPRKGAPTPPVVDDGPVIASPEVIAAAKKLKCASNDQIPFVIAPRKHMAAWTGGDDDSDDYDRACAVRGVKELIVGDGRGLVGPAYGSLMFWSTKTGGLLIQWIGADSTAGCIAAALSIPDKEWKKQKATFTVAKGAEELVIFDSFARGDSLKKNGAIGDDDSATASFKLAAGIYTIDEVASFDANVKVGKRVEETCIGVLRLTKR